MRRCVLLCLAFASLSACNGDKVVQPIMSPHAPTTDISDATHGLAGNPDFFFLPPMVKNPNASPSWDAGAFNPNLRPTVEICASTATTESGVASAACGLQSTLVPAVDRSSEQYQVNWKVPTSATIFYRITVKVGTTVLGFADVETGSNASQLKNVATNEYIPLVDGRTLPIKFRIERYALCRVPGTGPCTSAVIDPAVGGTVSTVLPGTNQPSGVVLDAGSTAEPINVTVESCGDLHERRAVDLPTFGPCVRVNANGGHITLLKRATVFACDVSAIALANDPRIVGPTQARLVTLHRYDEYTPAEDRSPTLTALSHAEFTCPSAGSTASRGTVGELFAALAHGRFGAAARSMGAMFAPQPLYAARFIDLGVGGYTESFSDFQFALPAKFGVHPDVADGYPAVGERSVLTVTDLEGTPVAGARVTLTVNNAAPLEVQTDRTGIVKATLVEGSNHVTGGGFGIGGSDFNGPRVDLETGRDIIDPFQPIHPDGDPVHVGDPVELHFGTLSVTLTGVGPATVCSDATTTLVAAPSGSVPRAASVVSQLDFDWGSALGGTRTLPNSQWISIASDGWSSVPVTTYVFERTFTAARGMVLSGEIMYDDRVTILLNGNAANLVAATGVQPWQGVATFSAQGLVAGSNTLRFSVENTGGPSGANFCFTTSGPIQ